MVGKHTQGLRSSEPRGSIRGLLNTLRVASPEDAGSPKISQWMRASDIDVERRSAVQWLGVMPRLVSKRLSSRATHYIHDRPSPSPTILICNTPACQSRACLSGSSRQAQVEAQAQAPAPAQAQAQAPGTTHLRTFCGDSMCLHRRARKWTRAERHAR